MIQYHVMDYLDGIQMIQDQSVQLVFTDPPYNTTACKWDYKIDLQRMWYELQRIITPDGALVFFCQQPFTSELIQSNLNWFKYMWYWQKSRPAGHTNAKLKPLKDIEEIAVFSPASTANGAKLNMKYRPQGLIEVNKSWKRPRKYGDGTGVNTTRPSNTLERVIQYTNYPRQVLSYNNDNHNLIHDTQKPLDLCEYIIRTYTDFGDLTVDIFAGSASIGIAADKSGRHNISFERDAKIAGRAIERINQYYADQTHE